MKTSIIAIVILATQASADFLRTRTLTTTCPATTPGSPVACGPDYMCIYDSECTAEAAGYNPTYCMDHVEHSCPTGSGNLCPAILDPVQCEDSEGFVCHYDNECTANAAGQTNCQPARRNLLECQVPKQEPMKCGPDYSCAYSTQCDALSAGYNPSYCLPVGNNCPSPGGNACPLTWAPVQCQNESSDHCFYQNDCVAQAAGVVGCTPYIG